MTPDDREAEQRRNAHGRRRGEIAARRAFSPLVITVIVGCVPLLVWAMFASASDHRGDTPWGTLVLVSPVVPTVLSVLLLLAVRRPGVAWEGLQRTLFVAFAAGVLYGVVVGIVFALPAFQSAIVFGDDGHHSMWPAGSGNPMLAPMTVGAGLALLAGAGAVVWVLLPVVALVRPSALGPTGWGTTNDDGTYRPGLVRVVRLGVALMATVLFAAVALPLGWHPWSWIALAVSAVLAVLVVRQQLAASDQR